MSTEMVGMFNVPVVMSERENGSDLADFVCPIPLPDLSGLLCIPELPSISGVPCVSYYPEVTWPDDTDAGAGSKEAQHAPHDVQVDGMIDRLIRGEVERRDVDRLGRAVDQARRGATGTIKGIG